MKLTGRRPKGKTFIFGRSGIIKIPGNVLKVELNFLTL
ncbi:Uncharacterized protein dnm_076750 [Desulfonema magnum]|uniref:Uncharacterized protein n=1 Tax=Desulfonema magnum TaxID=45655 RepID=A0A975GS26_9BACT|nr:Uncharacterized protein dnm_076750 [Desulfonema magnum]